MADSVVPKLNGKFHKTTTDWDTLWAATVNVLHSSPLAPDAVELARMVFEVMCAEEGVPTVGALVDGQVHYNKLDLSRPFECL
ncbi:MAG: hypothetical protein JSS66_07435 [Armatimonadetes bacterium]|nr:hypothetical protein [Armatimonadota bacterium]